MAIPEMGELASTYKDKLNIVSISTDNKNVWERASKEHPMTWDNWNDLKGNAGIYAQYDQRGIPNYTLRQKASSSNNGQAMEKEA